MNLHPLILSIQVTLAATAAIFVVGLGLALVLARARFPGKALLETLTYLPLVLPPSVVGYYLLIFLGRDGPLVSWFDVNFLFTWYAAVIASTIVALPLMVQSAKAALESVDVRLENAARTLGLSEAEIIRRVTIPLAWRGIMAGLILGSARALGEFGATLMIAGNIPGRTQTAPLAIYDAVQGGRFAEANMIVLMMTLLSLVSLLTVSRIQRRVPNPNSYA